MRRNLISSVYAEFFCENSPHRNIFRFNKEKGCKIFQKKFCSLINQLPLVSGALGTVPMPTKLIDE